MKGKPKSIFSGSIISAYYFDTDYATIEVLYDINDEIHNYILEADPDNPDYKALLAEGWDNEKLAKATEQYKREQSFEFNNAIQASVDTILQQSKLAILEESRVILHKELSDSKDIMKKEIIDEQAKNPSVLDIRSSNPFLTVDMFDIILEGNTNKDMIFKFKLWALELDNIKTSTKAVKTKIRKAKSLFEGISIIAPLM